MRKIPVVLLGLTTLAVAVAACAKKQDPPPVTPAASAQPYGTQYPAQPGQPGYPPPGQPGQPGAQPGYPPPGQPGQPGQPGAAQPGQMAVPGPMALACQNDSQCFLHKCNTQYGKCAFPCATDADCIQGSSCLAAGPAPVCVPKQPGQ